MSVLGVITVVLVASMMPAAIRLVLGPGLVNRVVALDVLAILGAALTALLAIKFNQRVLLDVTVMLALIGFVGTVAFAYYAEQGDR